MLRRPLLRRQSVPAVERLLRLTEYQIDAFVFAEFVVNQSGVAFVSQRQLIFQIDKLVVDGRRRQHQHFCFHTLPNDFFQQNVEPVVF